MKIGGKIRKVRETQNLTIRDIAERTGLTSSLISQVERDLAMPSIATLKKIADSLGITVAMLFQDGYTESPVVRENERKRITYGGNSKFYHELLNNNVSSKKVAMLYNEWEVGASTDGFLSHNGEEGGIVLEGEVEITIGTDVFTLRKGDSVYFNSSVPHFIKNIGDSKLKMIWFNTPPSF